MDVNIRQYEVLFKFATGLEVYLYGSYNCCRRPKGVCRIRPGKASCCSWRQRPLALWQNCDRGFDAWVVETQLNLHSPRQHWFIFSYHMFSSVHCTMQSGLRNTLLIVVVSSILYMTLVLEKAYKSTRTLAMSWDMKYYKGKASDKQQITSTVTHLTQYSSEPKLQDCQSLHRMCESMWFRWPCKLHSSVWQSPPKTPFGSQERSRWQLCIS